MGINFFGTPCSFRFPKNILDFGDRPVWVLIYVVIGQINLVWPLYILKRTYQPNLCYLLFIFLLASGNSCQ